MKKLYCILLAVLCLGTVGCILFKSTQKTSKISEVFIDAKRKRIENEIANLHDHPWAGQYYNGDGLGANITLTLAPKNGFTITWYGCLGLYDQNHGTVDWDGNTIKLSFKSAVEDGGIGSYASEYKSIRWGERLYLIPTDKVIQFCYAVNSGDEPRTGRRNFSRFFLREGDWDKKVEGKPEIPVEFAAYLLDEPIEAAIVSVGNIQQKDSIGNTADVVINKGKRDGLQLGMRMHVVKPGVFGRMDLTSVGETHSEGELYYSPDGQSEERIPTTDWRLSTRSRWK